MAYFIYRYLMQLVAYLARRVGMVNTKLNLRNQGLRSQKIPKVERCIWIHCASLGEFEQGKVLIDALRLRYPSRKLVLTFFSSSGFEKRKNYNRVDHVFYLPYDTPKAMARFVNQLDPDLVIFVKYEFWFTLLDILASKAIPFVFVSASFRSSQYLFLPLYTSLLSRILHANHIFVQNKVSRELLIAKGYEAVTVAGDTRIDRVLELSKQDFEWPYLEQWIENCTIVMGGSTWPKDEVMLHEVIPHFVHWKWIIAPHEISRDHMNKLSGLWKDELIFLSETGMDQPLPQQKSILIIDKIGVLSLLYRFGDIAYIGGGHGAGIHNTLEPTVYGLPLIFGPNYTKFQEAIDFVTQGVARVVHDQTDLKKALTNFGNAEKRREVNAILTQYFERRSGATSKIMRTIENLISER